MTTAVDPDNTPLPGTVFTPRQVRLLKVAVVVMGLLLLAGLAAVIVGMIYQASKAGATKTPVAASSAEPPAALGLPHFTLPKEARISSIALDGNRLALHLILPDRAEIAVIDVNTGKLLSRVTIESEESGAQ